MTKNKHSSMNFSASRPVIDGSSLNCWFEVQVNFENGKSSKVFFAATWEYISDEFKAKDYESGKTAWKEKELEDLKLCDEKQLSEGNHMCLRAGTSKGIENLQNWLIETFEKNGIFPADLPVSRLNQ